MDDGGVDEMPRDLFSQSQNTLTPAQIARKKERDLLVGAGLSIMVKGCNVSPPMQTREGKPLSQAEVNDRMQYWPKPPNRTKLYEEPKSKRYLENFYDSFCKTQADSGTTDAAIRLFPQKREPGTYFNDCSDDEKPVETRKKGAKRYDFSKQDTFAAEGKNESKFLLYSELMKFMLKDLEVGDRIEAANEIIYANEGLVIPVGRKGTVKKVKLDMREDFAAVNWDFVKGMHAIDTRCGYFIKEPIDVVFGWHKAVSAIQWPTAETVCKASCNITSTYERGTVDKSEVKAVGAWTIRLRQGYNENNFALESSTVPKMMLTVVASGIVGLGGIKDPRRLQMVDYTDKDGLDKACCFRPKRISDKQIRLESCLEKNMFVLLKLTNDPKVTPPFLYIGMFEITKAFNDACAFSVLRTRKEQPKEAKNKYGVMVENKLYLMKQAFQSRNTRVMHVDIQVAGMNQLCVQWRPNVGKVRIWCQYKSIDPTMKFLSTWICSANSVGGTPMQNRENLVAVVDTKWCNGFEDQFQLVRVCVAPTDRQHRFQDIHANNFFSCGAQISDWGDLPPTPFWSKSKEKVKKKYTGLSDSESDEGSGSSSPKSKTLSPDAARQGLGSRDSDRGGPQQALMDAQMSMGPQMTIGAMNSDATQGTNNLGFTRSPVTTANGPLNQSMGLVGTGDVQNSNLMMSRAKGGAGGSVQHFPMPGGDQLGGEIPITITTSTGGVVETETKSAANRNKPPTIQT